MQVRTPGIAMLLLAAAWSVAAAATNETLFAPRGGAGKVDISVANEARIAVARRCRSKPTASSATSGVTASSSHARRRAGTFVSNGTKP